MDQSLIGRWAVNLQGRLAQIEGYAKHPGGEVHAIGTALDGGRWEAQAPTMLTLSDSITLSTAMERRQPNA